MIIIFSANSSSSHGKPERDNESNADIFEDGDDLSVIPDINLTESVSQIMVKNFIYMYGLQIKSICFLGRVQRGKSVTANSFFRLCA